MPTDIQKKLRAIRKICDISQREVGNKLNLSTAQICNYELGRPPSSQRTRQLILALGKLADEKGTKSNFNFFTKVETA